jgi:phenylacetate-CoA ligase
MQIDYLDPFIETLGRQALTEIQLKKLQLMLAPLLENNSFYREKLIAAGLTSPNDVKTLDDYSMLPFTTKAELSADQLANPPYGSNLTFPREQYTRIHQTSGTKGEPLRCLDTEESWSWWARCWATVYKAAGIYATDRIFFAFSFGPFIGFWSAYEGARLIGALSIPGGGMSSYQRLKAILTHEVTVLICTPTYALHLVETAEDENIDIYNSNVRILIHAGEPGASLPSTRERIQQAWGAKVFDHAGATEVGAWGFETQIHNGVHINEGEFIGEVIDPVTKQPADEGELIITNLGRVGMPVIRYQTGDRVKLSKEPCKSGRTFQLLDGGVIGRVDDVIIIRGVNVFPSALENIIRQSPEIGEFAVDIYRRSELDDLDIRIEISKSDPDVATSDLSKRIRSSIGIRANIKAVPYGSLPRFDLKARRFTDHRNE